ncbi:hypothetical protein HKD37_07G019411 [Glycine soja]
MEADMEAMKEQMAAMMEAMMSMKKIMEANAVAIAATSTVAKVNPTSPSGINQMNHPTSDMVGKDLGTDFEPWLGYATEGQAVGGIPFENTLEGPQYHPQLHLLHSTTSKNPHAMAEMGKLDHLEERLRAIEGARKPVEFTPIPVSYANLLPYLLDNSMVAITLTKVHQPLFLREYDSNATCACRGEAPGHSIEHCRGLKRKVQGLIDAGWLKFEENRM